MTSDYASKEKAFLESLKADTGRDLSQWMSAIHEQNLAHRNDIIDWLRHQGFIFSRASWLERIHHNEGRPIYLSELPESQMPTPRPGRASLRLVASNPDLPPASTPELPPRAPDIASNVTPLTRIKPAVQPSPRSRESRQSANSMAKGQNAITSTIAKAKAYGPLARHFLNELTSALPTTKTTPFPNHLEFSQPKTFCALVMSPTRLRLCLDLGEHEFNSQLINTRVPNPVIRLPLNLTHMIVLDDARQINAELIALIKTANNQVNG